MSLCRRFKCLTPVNFAKDVRSDMPQCSKASSLNAGNPASGVTSDMVPPLIASVSNFRELANGERSVMRVSHACRLLSLSMPESGEMSDTGLPLIPNPSNFTKPESGDKSVIRFSSNPSHPTFLNSSNGDTSTIRLSRNLMFPRRVRLRSGAMSVIKLWRNSSRSKFVANSNPVKSRMPLRSARSSVNLSISSCVSWAFCGFPNAF